MSAVLKPLEARLENLRVDLLPAVCAVEQSAYSHPWTRANFIDSMAAGCHCQVLVGPGPSAVSAMSGDTVIGYFVAMKGVDEVHLLNVTVAPGFQNQGWAPLMLDALAGWSRGQGAQWLWLEVRASNARALKIYERQGYRRVGMRKAYYPAHNGREDAVVMSLRLNEATSTCGELTA